MIIPLTQTNLWANLNKHYYGLKPYVFTHNGISCLFGIDAKNSLLTSFGGPVVNEAASAQDLSDFLARLLDYANHQHISVINFRALFPLRRWSDKYELQFIQHKFKRAEWKTLIVDLKYTEEQLYKNFAHAARKGIKKAQQMGVVIERCNSFEKYYSTFRKL